MRNRRLAGVRVRVALSIEIACTRASECSGASRGRE
jgi:hypothetical protein